MREVLARIRSVLRRTTCQPGPAPEAAPAGEDKRFSFADWTVNFSTMELQDADGRPVELTTSELRLLEVFLANPRRILSRDQLMDKLKGHDWSPLDRSIDNQIAPPQKEDRKRLRKPAVDQDRPRRRLQLHGSR